MKFYFTIDALSAAGNKAWRLQEDRETWRECTYAEPITAKDASVSDQVEAEKLTGLRLKKHKDLGLIVKGKPGTFDFLMRGIFSHAVLHRLSAAPIPDKIQMIEKMKSLKPGSPWLLYLNPAGQFQGLDTSNGRIIGNLDIAVRGEIASSPDYIGEKPAADEKIMDTLYRQFLGGWFEHLQTRNMAIFIPDADKMKEEEQYR
ncbi:MAG: hypothetical protein R8K22_08365, partial [Mariprofundaceae bacterium]